MKAFDFHSPKTLDEAYALLDRYREDYAVVAGGTDILIELHDHKIAPRNVIDISKIPVLKGIFVKDGVMRVGAMSTFTEVERNATVQDRVRVLFEAASTVGSPQIRNLGTVGGNLVNASVAGDSLAAFITLDADVVLGSKNGTRRMKLVDFYSDNRRTQLERGEIMTEILFDLPDSRTGTSYAKLGKRKALAIVVLGVGVMLQVDEQERCKRAHVVLGAVSRYPRRLPRVEEALVGQKVTRDLLYAQLPVLTEIVKELIPGRASMGYKSESVRGMARLAFDSILKELRIA